MTIPLTEDQYKQKDNLEREKSFSEFLAKPTIRLLISTLPAMESQETIKTLLQEAHTHGWGGGSARMMIMLLEGLMRGPKP